MSQAQPTNTIDHSDRLAYESALIHELTDIDPDGQWQQHELYQRRRNRRYGGLTVGEMDDLLDYLEFERAKLETAQYLNWLTRHQPPEDDAQTQSLEPTKTPMA